MQSRYRWYHADDENTVGSDRWRPGGRLRGDRGVQQSSERQFHIEADYFIDATGDGTVSAKAGVPFSVGNGNHETLGNSILYYTRREDHPVSFIAPDYAYDMSHIDTKI